MIQSQMQDTIDRMRIELKQSLQQSLQHAFGHIQASVAAASNHHSSYTFQFHEPTLHQTPQPDFHFPPPYPHHPQPDFHFPPHHPLPNLPPLPPTSPFHSPIQQPISSEPTPYYPPMYPENYYPEPPVEPNPYYYSHFHHQHTCPDIPYYCEPAIVPNPYYSHNLYQTTAPALHQPPSDFHFPHSETNQPYQSTYQSPIEHHLNMEPSCISIEPPPIDSIESPPSTHANVVFDEMPERIVENFGEHLGYEKAEVLHEGEDDFGQTIGEIHSSAITVSCPNTFQFRTPHLSYESPPIPSILSPTLPTQGRLPLELFTIVTGNRNLNENFVEIAEIPCAHNMFDIIPQLIVCCHNIPIPDLSPHAHYYSFLSLNFPGLRPPSQPPDLPQGHEIPLTPSPQITPHTSSSLKPQPQLSHSICQLKIDFPLLSPRNFLDCLPRNVWRFKWPHKIQVISPLMNFTPPYANMIALVHNGSSISICFVMEMMCQYTGISSQCAMTRNSAANLLAKYQKCGQLLVFLLHRINYSCNFSKPTKLKSKGKFEWDLSTLHPTRTECSDKFELKLDYLVCRHLLDSFVKAGRIDNALDCMDRMITHNVLPSVLDTSFVLAALVRKYMILEPQNLHKKMAQNWKAAMNIVINGLLVLIYSTMPDKGGAAVALLSVAREDFCIDHFRAYYFFWLHRLLTDILVAQTHFVKLSSCASASELFRSLGRLFSVESVETDVVSIQLVLKLLIGDSLESVWKGATQWSCTLMASFSSSVHHHYKIFKAGVVLKMKSEKFSDSTLKKLAYFLHGKVWLCGEFQSTGTEQLGVLNGGKITTAMTQVQPNLRNFDRALSMMELMRFGLAKKAKDFLWQLSVALPRKKRSTSLTGLAINCKFNMKVSLLEGIHVWEMESVEKAKVFNFQINVLLPEFTETSSLVSVAVNYNCSMKIAFVKGDWVMLQSCKSPRVQEKAACALVHVNAFLGRMTDVLEALMLLTLSWSWWLIMKASLFERQQNHPPNIQQSDKGLQVGM